MGFEVEKHKKSQDLWDLHPKTQPKSSRPEQINISSQQINPSPRQQFSSSKQRGSSSKQRVSSSAKNVPSSRPGSSSAGRFVGIILIFFVSVTIITFAYSFLRASRRNTNEPIKLSARLSMITSVIPLPEGMEISKYDLGVDKLTIYLKGTTETKSVDYITSKIFAFRLIEEVNNMIFVEEDTGKTYEFKRQE